MTLAKIMYNTHTEYFMKEINSNNRAQVKNNSEKMLNETWKPVFVLFFLVFLFFTQCAGTLWNWVREFSMVSYVLWEGALTAFALDYLYKDAWLANSPVK